MKLIRNFVLLMATLFLLANCGSTGNSTAETDSGSDDGSATTSPDPGSNPAPEPEPEPEPQPESVCGNGQIEANETCDDGELNGDLGQCLEDCSGYYTVCGDGVYHEVNEECDDGNLYDGDGCNDQCEIEDRSNLFPDCDLDDEYGWDLQNDEIYLTRALDLCGEVETTIHFNDVLSWKIYSFFGNNENNQLPTFIPKKGHSSLMLSTGRIENVDPSGTISEVLFSQTSNNGNGNPNNDDLPDPLNDAWGSNGGMGGTPFYNCDGIGDCSDLLKEKWAEADQYLDNIWLEINAQVPEYATGIKWSTAFCSSEWPNFVNTIYKDRYLTWLSDPNYSGIVNIVYQDNLDDAALMDIDSFNEYWVNGYGEAWTPGINDDDLEDMYENSLTHTGFETHACSRWLDVSAKVTPGADIKLIFYLTDSIDAIQATAVLLDNFRWTGFNLDHPNPNNPAGWGTRLP